MCGSDRVIVWEQALPSLCPTTATTFHHPTRSPSPLFLLLLGPCVLLLGRSIFSFATQSAYTRKVGQLRRLRLAIFALPPSFFFSLSLSLYPFPSFITSACYCLVQLEEKGREEDRGEGRGLSLLVVVFHFRTHFARNI